MSVSYFLAPLKDEKHNLDAEERKGDLVLKDSQNTRLTCKNTVIICTTIRRWWVPTQFHLLFCAGRNNINNRRVQSQVYWLALENREQKIEILL